MLDGLTVLVTEAEFLIALDVQRMLEGLGARQVLFARTAEEALAMEPYWSDVSLAIVEIPLERQSPLRLIQRLGENNIPIVVCSADTGLRRGVPQFPALPVVTKPMAETDLVSAINEVFNPAR